MPDFNSSFCIVGGWTIQSLTCKTIMTSWAKCCGSPLALAKVATYAGRVVKQPFINLEEKIDRNVGRRAKTPDAMSMAGSTKADSIAWRKAFGGVRIPRGIHRFKTHEEADKWLWRMIARPTN